MADFIMLHGANPENLYRAFNIDIPEKILDFSTNTNILAWPEKINLDIESLASRYPDPDCEKLRNIIALLENISPEKILFTNGTNEAIFLLSRILSGKIAILQPCYSEYKRAFMNAHEIFKLDDIINFDNIILVNPNNPTGKYIANLSEIINFYPEKLFIIDEAYIDFLLNDLKRERLCDFKNIILLRSLTKIFHLSGARIGYIIANENIITRLKNFLPSWSVNAFAQELALYFLNNSNFYERTRNFYMKETPIFIRNLRLAGFNVMDSDVHYFLLRVNDDYEVLKFLLKNGIAARHTRNFTGLDGKYLRIATRLLDENKFFVDVITMLYLQ